MDTHKARCNVIKHSITSLQWRYNGRDSVWNHQSHDSLLNRIFRHRWKKTSKLRVTGLCEGNSLVTSEFSAQRNSKAENDSIWWSHHELCIICPSSSGVVFNAENKPTCQHWDKSKDTLSHHQGKWDVITNPCLNFNHRCVRVRIANYLAV